VRDGLLEPGPGQEGDGGPRHDAEAGAQQAEHDPVGEHDAPQVGGRAAVGRHQGELALAAPGADREGGPGQQHDLEQR